MIEFLSSIAEQLWQNNVLELIAVVFAVLYLLLAVKENILCWAAAIVSTTIYLFVFWDVNLYMESGLQIYYLCMAVFGWHQWRHANNKAGLLRVSVWSARQHVLALIIIIVLTIGSGLILNSETNAQLPFLDSFTTWGSVVTTFMVARKVLENWIYWLVIDSVSIYLYIDRELYFTAMLFAAYIVIVFFGWFSWLKSYQQNASSV